MQRIALRTRLKADAVDEYEKVHAVIPEDLDAALREGGVHTWRIWRDGLDLFHYVEVDDYESLQRFLRDNPADQAWQARINLLLDADFDPEATGLRMVWELP
jgi:L-rhamnose mutarotase